MTQTAPEQVASENPLRSSRLNDSRDFRPEWDVASLNESVSKSLLADIRRLTGRRDPDPGQQIPVLLSAGGYGKTHLFGRLAFALSDRAFFVFVGAISDPMRPLDHIRWNVVETLFQPRAGKASVLAEALAALFHPSIVEYVRRFPPAEAARHQPLRRALEEGPEPVLEMVSHVASLQPFIKLADSAVAAMPGISASVIRALVLGWSPQAQVVRRWLRGESITTEESATLGLEENPPQPLETLKGIAAVLQYRKPMVICCDQLDSILKDPEGPRQLGIQLMELLAAVPGQFIVLSCLEDAWEVMVKNQGFDAFKQRTRIFRLDFLNEDQALALLRNRLRDWPGRKPELGNLWPFEGDSLARFVRDKQPTPRVLIQRCAEAFEKWDDGLIASPIALGERDAVLPLSELFRKEWERELAAIRQDPLRTPEHVSEARLYAAVKEMVALAKSADGSLGGLHVEGFKEGILPSGAANPRYSAKIDLRLGNQTVPIVIVVSKINGGVPAFQFVVAIERAMQHVSGLLLIHVRSDFTMGPGGRKTYDRLKDSGKLVVYSLEDHATAFQRLECALSLLDKAHSGDLQLGDAAVTFDHCRRLILETQLISNLDLFKALTSWHTGVPSTAVHNEAVPVKPAHPAIASAPSTARPAVAPQQTSLFTGNGQGDSAPPAGASNIPAESVPAWAAEKLALASEKLTAWGQKVEPVNYEIGPSFIRLNFRPIGNKTTYKKVCNRAMDLKVNLGLDFVPIIGSQSYFFTIDVQSPVRRIVTLEETLKQLPPGRDLAPMVPLGLDVAGRAHWLNLADPTDCHLLIAGTTGSGKSEFLKSVVAALASRLSPEQVQFMLIDPKRVTFNLAGSSPFLSHPVAHDLKTALPLLRECEQLTVKRYQTLQKLRKTDVGQLDREQASLLPRIVLIIDEFANLMVDKEANKALTDLLKRIGSMSRAAGIHLVLATQRPDHTVVPMLVRANLPGRIALQVDSEANSEMILDAPDAAYLLGKGDLFSKRGGSLIRAQSPLVSQGELERLLRLR